MSPKDRLGVWESVALRRGPVDTFADLAVTTWGLLGYLAPEAWSRGRDPPPSRGPGHAAAWLPDQSGNCIRPSRLPRPPGNVMRLLENRAPGRDAAAASQNPGPANREELRFALASQTPRAGVGPAAWSCMEAGTRVGGNLWWAAGAPKGFPRPSHDK